MGKSTMQRLGALFVGTVGAIGMLTKATFSHEMWIDAKQYQIETGDNIKASLLVGQNFKGYAQRFVPDRFVRMDIAAADTVVAVDGRIGDTPAIDTAPLTNGLNILVHQSTVLTTSYTSMEKFEAFVDHKGFADAVERHRARDLPEAGFREAYTRYAKALIGVGNGVGSDRAYGLDTEIVALENPYTDDVSDGLDLRVDLYGAPKAAAQVEVFELETGAETRDAVSVTIYMADANGNVTIPVKMGHSYLIDSVALREPSAKLAEEKNAVWETLWASLTFGVPAK